MAEIRIDKWMWAVRIFKTRTILAEACRKGRVSVGDTIVTKPSRTVRIGDIIKVRKPPVTYSFQVVGLTANRVGAKLVSQYMANVTPQEQLDLLDVVRLTGFQDRRKGLGRPTKRDGRQLQQFAQETGTDGWDFDFDFDDNDGDEEDIN